MKTWQWLTMAAATGWYISKRLAKRQASSFREMEDVDAYNTDDQQPPFEEKSPRQRTL